MTDSLESCLELVFKWNKLRIIHPLALLKSEWLILSASSKCRSTLWCFQQDFMSKCIFEFYGLAYRIFGWCWFDWLDALRYCVGYVINDVMMSEYSCLSPLFCLQWCYCCSIMHQRMMFSSYWFDNLSSVFESCAIILVEQGRPEWW